MENNTPFSSLSYTCSKQNKTTMAATVGKNTVSHSKSQNNSKYIENVKKIPT